MKTSSLPNADSYFPPKTTCICVGQPGRDRHHFPYVYVSWGNYLGYKGWVDPNKRRKKKVKNDSSNNQENGLGKMSDQSNMVISLDADNDKDNSNVEKDRTFLQDNSDIGALIHDCWTYWGHSGGPIIFLPESPSSNTSSTSSSLSMPIVGGLHSSWDFTNGNRHGVHIECIWGFFQDMGVDIHSFYRQFE